MSFTKRSIPLTILLCIVTCGIYTIYWYFCIAKEFYESRTASSLGTTPGITLLLNIITCGIYGIYAYYKWGKQTSEIFAAYGRPGEDKSLLYIILSIFGLSIITLCIIQNDFNNFSDMGPIGYQVPPQAAQPYNNAPVPPPPGSPYSGNP